MTKRTQWRLLMRALAVLAAWALPAMSFAQMGDMLPDRAMGMSRLGFKDTVDGLQKAIEGQGMMVIHKVDHQAMLAMVGVKTKGMVTLEFFHPKYGKVVFEGDHRAGVDIPLRLVVMDGDMGVMFTYRKPSATFSKYPKLANLGAELDGAVESITAAVAKR